MASQVAHGAVAEIPPAIPFRSWKIDVVERPLRRRPEPEVPIQSRRNWISLLRPIQHIDNIFISRGVFRTLPSPRAPDPHMRFIDRPDRAALNQFNNAVVVLLGMNLNAHLRSDI